MAFKGDDSTFSLATTVTLALAVAAMVFVKEPLKSSRPVGNSVGLGGAASELKARARLWEDPFAAVERDREVRKKISVAQTGKGKGPPGAVTVSVQSGDVDGEGLDSLWRKLRNAVEQKEQVTALVVMTGSGSSVEAGEARIRDRYAVGAALEVGCFTPDKGESISYFTWSFATDLGAHSQYTPYEWYSRSKITPCRTFNVQAGQAPVRQVLVLWVKAEESEQIILARIHALLAKVRPSDLERRIPAKLVGPRSSSEFRSILQEIQRGGNGNTGAGRQDPQKSKQSGRKTNEPIALYSPWATAMPGLLSYGMASGSGNNEGGCRSYLACKQVFVELLSEAGLILEHGIDSDAVLFESLFDELNRRQVTVGVDPIALIGEWDSFYARALPLTFSAAACRYITDANANKDHPPSKALVDRLRGKCDTTEEGIDPFKIGDLSPHTLHIRKYSYLSGLDGETSNDSLGTSKLKDAEKEKDKTDGGQAKLRDIASYERPEGPSQLDYVRRLVARIETEDQDQAANPEGRKVKAIGILGRDAYDALLILQAVREQFPNALFFATDLDARYFHEDEQKWARNLIVVSHFGLQLESSLQEAIPPFRHSLQTSTFFAVLRAIDRVGYQPPGTGQNRDSSRFILPGSHGIATEYSVLIRPRLFEIGRHGAVDLSVDKSRSGEKSIHPARTDVDGDTGRLKLPPRIASLWMVGLLLGFLALWGYGRLWNWLTARDELDPTEQRLARIRRSAWVFIPVIGALWFWCQIVHFNYAEDEPFSWSDGMSIWPTEALRVFAISLCLFFQIKASADSASNIDDLTKSFFPDVSCQSTAGGWRNALKGFWRDLDWIFHGSKQDHPGEASALWGRYCRAHKFSPRIGRVALGLAGYFGLILPLCLFMNDGELRLFVPCRGTFSCSADRVFIILSVLSFLILNLAVLDAVVLCTKWVQEMPATAGLSEMTQIRLIVERTKIVNRRILYPFLALFLLIAARSHYFDNWDFPPVLILALTVNSLVALASACMLYLAAVGAKRKVLAPLQLKVDRALTQQECAEPGVDPGPSSDHLRQIISEIEAVQQGAFVPFYQQPVVQATLVAALAFLQYWYLGQ
ncbi:MAG: hypothetical protein AABZ34_03665 [Nitrospirota bacterium]